MASKKLPTLPITTALPTLAKVTLPTLASPAVVKPKTIKQLQEEAANPLDHGEYSGDNYEYDLQLMSEGIEDEFAEIREARRRQAEAVDLANDTEFWCAFYFQTREQSEAFTTALKMPSDKYIDGLEAARILGITLPERAAPYKVGKIDKKLADLT